MGSFRMALVFRGSYRIGCDDVRRSSAESGLPDDNVRSITTEYDWIGARIRCSSTCSLSTALFIITAPGQLTLDGCGESLVNKLQAPVPDGHLQAIGYVTVTFALLERRCPVRS